MVTKHEAASTDVEGLQAEITRLEKIVRVLMDRVEQSTEHEVTEFGLFQRTILLEHLVQQRTAELNRALSRNERITRVLRQSEARFRGMADQALAGIAIVESGSFTYVNARFAETFGYQRKEITAVDPMAIVMPESRQSVLDLFDSCMCQGRGAPLLDHKALRKDGTIVEIELACSRMRAGDKLALLVVVFDVTARKEAERQVQALNLRLSEQALRDPLTGLYNRRFMEESFERELLRARRTDAPLSVVMCDLDHFKAINDRYGHQAGDRVLKTFGTLLKRRCRGSDIVCRYGGEEFLLVLPNMPGHLAAEWAEHLRVALAQASIAHGGNKLRVTASFGVAVFPDDGDTLQQVVSSADAAQYAAKAAGRNRVECASGVECPPA